jgi:hypothetical protein
MHLLMILMLFLLPSCSGGDNLGPGNGVPRLGRYAYTFSAQGLQASGVMRLTYATADSIAGQFEVTGYRPTFDLGFRNQDSYVVYAHPSGGGIAQHRLRPTGSELTCESAQYFISFSDLRPGSCSTTYQGP